MTEPAIEADVTVDSREATCPGPMMDLIGKVESGEPGTVYELRTTDSGSKDDVPAWVEKAGHELLDTVDRGDYWSIYVEKT